MMGIDSGNTTPSDASPSSNIILNTAAPSTDENGSVNSTDVANPTSQATAQKTQSPTVSQAPKPTQG